MNQLEDYRLSVIAHVACPFCGKAPGHSCTYYNDPNDPDSNMVNLPYVHDDRSLAYEAQRIGVRPTNGDGERPGYVYVASSWRCLMQDSVIQTLRIAGIPAYDFKNPEGGSGFSWSEVMTSFNVKDQLADMNTYLTVLKHPRSIEGFNSDFEAMKRADTFVLVLPCGRSAHLELGWAVGAGKRTAILLDPDDDDLVTPELMYKMVDYIAPTLFDLLGWLGVED